MNQRMRNYLSVLRSLMRMSVKDRRRAVANCNRDLIDCFCECALNVLKGNVPLTKAQLTKLRREKQNLRQLTLKKVSLKKKKKILQKGGFIGALLRPVLSLLAGLIGSYGAR